MARKRAAAGTTTISNANVFIAPSVAQSFQADVPYISTNPDSDVGGIKRAQGYGYLKRQRLDMPSLPWGSACLNCRRRKMRCDGQRPKCSPCLNSDIFNDCEYRNERTAEEQSLEYHISALEARIQELQTGETGPTPKVAGHDLQRTGSEVYLHAAPSSAARVSASGFQDIPPVLSQMLLHNFVHKSCSLGFFLHEERFKNSLALNAEGERPTFALLNTSYLWGMLLSSSENHTGQDRILVSRALQSSAHALSENHPQKVLQCIQSEVLLANYFYFAGRILEGNYHSTAAASLVLSGGTHKIRTSSPDASGYLNLNPLAEPRDAIEEGERINAFWTVLTLDAFWNTVHGVPSSIPYTTPMARVDTPWPRTMEEYTQVPFDPDFRSSHTIEQFLSTHLLPSFIHINTRILDGLDFRRIFGILYMEFLPAFRIQLQWRESTHRAAYDGRVPFDPDFRSSHTIEQFLSGDLDSGIATALLSQSYFSRAAILFERATFTGIQLLSNPHSQQSQENFTSLDTLIRDSSQVYCLQVALSESPLDCQFCVHSLAHAADIQLHLPFASQNNISRTRIFTAAKAIVNLIDTWGHILEVDCTLTPMLAVIWTIACKVFVDDSIRMQYFEARALCERVKVAMERYSFPIQLAQVIEASASSFPASQAA
ncbi:hypothetical protein BT96DRAFT_1020477 [Gymnopus androsaceus JB14]|uniref:Zn(2)-C6 fungal-type domain-containing protein n=1 Tax=Gymnopus androsaceus JB14 TaxID=1447944 RepID=A0A6A4HIY7_9AGAR|nr:hypothetical protein BT96DRAFT_1020477 [Gymnopus androsaceus JB14]